MSWIILVIILILLAWPLVAPFQLIIDSEMGKVEFHWKSIGRIGLWANEEAILLLKVNIGCFHRTWKPLEWQSKPQNNQPKKVKKKRKSNIQNLPFQLIYQLLSTFRVRYFRLDLDTDDFVLNSYLYPFAFTLQRMGWQVSINYAGRSYFTCCVENQLARIGWTVIQYYIFSYKKSTSWK